MKFFMSDILKNVHLQLDISQNIFFGDKAC